jgi:hypothetical protein
MLSHQTFILLITWNVSRNNSRLPILVKREPGYEVASSFDRGLINKTQQDKNLHWQKMKM